MQECFLATDVGASRVPRVVCRTVFSWTIDQYKHMWDFSLSLYKIYTKYIHNVYMYMWDMWDLLQDPQGRARRLWFSSSSWKALTRSCDLGMGSFIATRVMNTSVPHAKEEQPTFVLDRIRIRYYLVGLWDQSLHFPSIRGNLALLHLPSALSRARTRHRRLGIHDRIGV